MDQNSISVTITDNQHPDLLNRIPKLIIEKEVKERLAQYFAASGIAPAAGDTILTDIGGERLLISIRKREIHFFAQEQHCLFLIGVRQ